MNKLITNVEFIDVSEEYGNDSDTYVIECDYKDTYLGFIALDNGFNFYTFYPQTEKQLSLPEDILQQIAERLFCLNAERKLN